MKVYVTFDVDDGYREVEKKAHNAQELLDSIIYDYQIGMPTTKEIVVESRKFFTVIKKENK